MLELAILTCIEAQVIIRNIEGGDLPPHIQVELIQTVLDRSDCDGNVRLSKVLR